MRKIPLLLVALGMLIVAPGCRSGTAPDEELDLGQLLPNFLAVSWRLMEKQLADFNADLNRPTGQFTHVEPCTDGGEMRVEGVVWLERDPGSGTHTLHVEGVKTPVNCTFPWGRYTYTIHGDPNLTLRGTGTLGGGASRPTQVTEIGSYTWRRVDRRRGGICIVDISSNINTQQRTGTVDGTWCQSLVDWAITWNPLNGG